MSKELFNILHRGYFPKELPPAFNTYTFALHANDLINNLQPGWNDVDAPPVRCSIPKNGIGRRYVHVLHPLPYFFLAKYVTENYADIKRVCAMSTISYSTPVITQSLKQRYIIPKSKNVASFQEGLQKKSLDKYVELKVDVSNFYPSVYTHIIPWTFVGKDVAQTIWRCRRAGTVMPYPKATIDTYDKANQIDDLIEKCQERQTHGIPVGPDSSYVIAEAILSYLDQIVLSKCPKATGCRYYDDYYLYFDTTEEAEQTLKVMIDEFKRLGLEINLAKVEINQLPLSVMERYAMKLSPFEFKSKRQDQTLQVYFELMWSLVRERPSKVQTILRYGLNTLERNLPTLSGKDEKLLYLLLFKTAILAPSALPEILKVAERAGGNPDVAIMKRMTDAVLRKHLQLGHHVELLWTLWTCKQYGLEMDVQMVVDMFRLNHPLCTLMLLDYLNNVKPAMKGEPVIDSEIKNLISSLTPDALYDERWMLLYEGVIKGWLPLLSIVQNDKFFNFLMGHNVSFYDVNKNADYANASYIINKPLSVPDFVTKETNLQTERLLKEIKESVIQQRDDEEDDLWEIDVEEELEEKIAENDTKNELFEELLHTIFSGEQIDDKGIIEKYVEILMSVNDY